MGRHFNVERLPVDQQALVNDTIRAHHYIVLDRILEDLKIKGIDGISRSSRGRYVPKLKAQDNVKAVR